MRLLELSMLIDFFLLKPCLSLTFVNLSQQSYNLINKFKIADNEKMFAIPNKKYLKK